MVVLDYSFFSLFGFAEQQLLFLFKCIGSLTPKVVKIELLIQKFPCKHS